VILKSLLPAYGGYTIARDEKVVLIKGAIPGEVVEVTIEEKKKDYSVASVKCYRGRNTELSRNVPSLGFAGSASSLHH
jgi:tRNA/tmRNA/rRNA uracil-C5-methylase (TrmA/RlmC/RlmD family)